MRLYAVAAVMLMLGAACSGGGGSDDSGAEAGDTAVLAGEPLLVMRALPATALSAEELEPAGSGTLGDGSELPFARTSASEVDPWDYISTGELGWRVWRAKVIEDVVKDAGDGAVLLEAQREEWPDACLGAPAQGEVCAQVVTPGYRVFVEADGQRIEYRTALDSAFRRVTP